LKPFNFAFSISSLETLIEKNVTHIIATGSALLRNKILQIELEKHYHSCTVEYTGAADSPFGAALHMLKVLNERPGKTI
jgi:hypothetical protein